MPQEGSTEFLVVVKGTEEINLRDHSPDGPAENAFVRVLTLCSLYILILMVSRRSILPHLQTDHDVPSPPLLPMLKPPT